MSCAAEGVSEFPSLEVLAMTFLFSLTLVGFEYLDAKELA